MNFTAIRNIPGPGALSCTSKSRTAIMACAAALALVTLSGCVSKQTLDGEAFLVGAMPLKSQDAYMQNGKSDVSGASAAAGKRDIIMNIANDSQTKCLTFLQELSVAETGSNTSLDIATTAFSALSTAFSPAATKTALSAASTITGGMKTAIDSDFYAKAAIADYTKAIQNTYFQSMKDFRNKMGTAADTDLDVGIQYGAIGSIHATCTLAAAQSAIAANLEPGGGTNPSGNNPSDNSASGQTPATTTTNVSVAAPLNEGDVVSLTAHSSAFTQPLAATTTMPAGGMSLADTTRRLVQSINANDAFKSRQITAEPGAVPNTIDLTAPTTLAVTWDPPKATPTGHARRGRFASRTVGKVESTTTAPAAVETKPASSVLYGTVPGQRY